jgi:hypothetical protein
MERFSVCKNPQCRFVLDRGGSRDSAENQQFLKECPACGSGWSSACPFCNQSLDISFVAGLPISACCRRRPRAEARAA